MAPKYEKDVVIVLSVFEFLRFWCSHYKYAFLFSSVFVQLRSCQRIHLAPFLRWINVYEKPKTELNISVFLQKWISVNRALDLDCRVNELGICS